MGRKAAKRQATFPTEGDIPEVTMGGVEPDEPEWRRMWARLAAVTGDADMTAQDPESGEAWQYLCSFHYARDTDAAWLHEFRHRWHPRIKERWVLHLPASPGWKPRRRGGAA